MSAGPRSPDPLADLDDALDAMWDRYAHMVRVRARVALAVAAALALIVFCRACG